MEKVKSRFDIDTITCIEDGTPALLKIAQKYFGKPKGFVPPGFKINKIVKQKLKEKSLS